MKPFYTHDVLVEVTREELLKMRVALSCWLIQHEDWQNSIEEDQAYYNKMMKLFKDVTKVQDALPF